MTYGRHLRAILILGLPLAGSQLAQMSLSLVDAAMLGWYDPTTLAAETLSMALFTVLFLAGSGFAAALAPLVAAAEGKGDTTQARRLTRMTLWLSALAGVVILPILLSAEAILLALGQTPALSSLAGEYLDILAWGIFPALGAMVLHGPEVNTFAEAYAWLRAEGGALEVADGPALARAVVAAQDPGFRAPYLQGAARVREANAHPLTLALEAMEELLARIEKA